MLPYTITFQPCTPTERPHAIYEFDITFIIRVLILFFVLFVLVCWLCLLHTYIRYTKVHAKQNE